MPKESLKSVCVVASWARLSGRIRSNARSAIIPYESRYAHGTRVAKLRKYRVIMTSRTRNVGSVSQTIFRALDKMAAGSGLGTRLTSSRRSLRHFIDCEMRVSSSPSVVAPDFSQINFCQVHMLVRLLYLLYLTWNARGSFISLCIQRS